MSVYWRIDVLLTLLILKGSLSWRPSILTIVTKYGISCPGLRLSRAEARAPIINHQCTNYAMTVTLQHIRRLSHEIKMDIPSIHTFPLSFQLHILLQYRYNHPSSASWPPPSFMGVIAWQICRRTASRE